MQGFKIITKKEAKELTKDFIPVYYNDKESHILNITPEELRTSKDLEKKNRVWYKRYIR